MPRFGVSRAFITASLAAKRAASEAGLFFVEFDFPGGINPPEKTVALAFDGLFDTGDFNNIGTDMLHLSSIMAG